jgi:glyoxylase-like metal-dependent hydrolase (beta-lactamase superfamily II)
MSIPFVRDMEVDYDTMTPLSPLVRRVIARNPGPFTFHGTGTYIIGHGHVAIIDPGPDDEAHIDALLNAVRGETVTHILVTHTHRDHSPAAASIKESTGAPTFAFAAHGGERSAVGVEEGADFDFQPDQKMSNGDRVSGPDWTIAAVHTPGHTANHLCFDLNEEATLFSGDHVMGWSTTIIAPPDGSMADYLASLRKLLERDDHLFRPTHGPAITDPKPLVRAYLDHRAQRTAQVQQCLDSGGNNIDEIVKSIYADHDPRLHRAAAHSILAHLIAMIDDGSVRCDDTQPELESRFQSAN